MTAESYVNAMPNNAKKYYARSYLKWRQQTEFPTAPTWGIVSPLKAHEIRLEIDRLLAEGKQ